MYSGVRSEGLLAYLKGSLVEGFRVLIFILVGIYCGEII